MRMGGGTGALAQEKRRAPRMPADWDVQARVLGDEEPLGVAKLANVSKGGLAVHLGHSVPRDAVMKLTFAPADGKGEVHAYATVAWVVTADQPLAGLRFIGIAENDEERLAGLVERWMLGPSRSRN